jgi:DNA-directed RNA polymerase specialized sigma subunit
MALDKTQQDLVIKYIPLAEKLAKQADKILNPKLISKEDLKGIAYLALCEAGNKYKRGSFYNYAEKWIRKEILRSYLKETKYAEHIKLLGDVPSDPRLSATLAE